MASDLTILVDSEILNLGFFSPIGSGEENDGANVGAGARVYRDKVGSIINLRTLTGVGDVSVVENGDEIEISHAAAGDVFGPAGSIDEAVPVFDGVTGKTIKESGASIDAGGNITTPGTVDGRDVSVDGGVLDAHVADTTIHFTQGRVVDSGYVEATAQSTTSAVLEDIAGASISITVPAGQTARVFAEVSISSSTTGGAPSTAAWAVAIDSVDGTEMPRFLSGSNDNGLGSAKASRVLSAGTYTVQARHRRVSGGSTINTDVAQLIAFAISE